jgi:hypothetical protein
MEPEAFKLLVLKQREKSCFPSGYFNPIVGSTAVQILTKWGLLHIIPKAKV